MGVPDFDDDDFDHEPDDFDDGEDGAADCALDPETGQCGKAGSEECDFGCPLRHSDLFAGSRAYCLKHKQLYYSEVDLARHALGLPNEAKRSHRNFFTAGEEHQDYQAWMTIVAKGLAVRIDKRDLFGGDWLFVLTQAGAEQALYEGESLRPDEFPQVTS